MARLVFFVSEENTNVPSTCQELVWSRPERMLVSLQWTRVWSSFRRECRVRVRSRCFFRGRFCVPGHRRTRGDEVCSGSCLPPGSSRRCREPGCSSGVIAIHCGGGSSAFRNPGVGKEQVL